MDITLLYMYFFRVYEVRAVHKPKQIQTTAHLVVEHHNQPKIKFFNERTNFLLMYISFFCLFEQIESQTYDVHH